MFYLYLYFLIFIAYDISLLNLNFMFYFVSYYSNHVNEISYFPRRCQLYIKKNSLHHSPKIASSKKPKHVSVMIFNYILNYQLIVFIYVIKFVLNCKMIYILLISY
jgi:hypothetical protein